MRRIAFVSPLGGCGRTTLAAHVAALLAQHGLQTLAIDLSAQNTLGLHLGARELPLEGWHPSAAQGLWWGSAAQENSAGVRLLPHGLWEAGHAQALQERLHQDSQWLGTQLAGLDLAGTGAIVLDTPPLPSPLARQAAHCADLVVLALDASERSLRLHTPLQSFVSTLPASTQYAVAITGVDPRRSSRRDALRALHQQWGDRVIPYPLHDDEFVQEALAHALGVHQHAPQSQSAHDLQGIADWVARACGLSLGGTP